jgi:gliding motility-associated lipoprotein GldD
MKINRLFTIGLLGLLACNEYTPKPHAYPRIEFPEHRYARFESEAPFSFEIPTYCRMQKDTDFNSEPFWYNLQFPPFDATLHISYKALRTPKDLDSLIDDSRRLVFKHTVKAEEIEEREIRDSLGNFGLFYDLYGNTATPLNFFISDRQNHFLRAAYYFNNYTERDSVAPVLQFVKKDILRMVETFRWEEVE